MISLETWNIDQLLIDQPGNAEIQLAFSVTTVDSPNCPRMSNQPTRLSRFAAPPIFVSTGTVINDILGKRKLRTNNYGYIFGYFKSNFQLVLALGEAQNSTS